MRWKISLLVFAAFFSACGRSGPPYSPEESLATFRIQDGFRAEVFVAEPDVVDPVAMEFDEEGRIWVVENSGYPLNIEGKVGRVKLLEDTDGDGRPDRSTVFADQLVMPTGVMRWKQGILVTDAPTVWYFEDTTGDGRADVRRAVLTGFPMTNPQHVVNSPLYGLDNWIYLAAENPATATIFKEMFGERKSDIRFADRDDIPPLPSHGRGMRFRPDTYQLERLSGASQFGQSFDEWGHHLTGHILHEVIASRYLDRNPDLPLRSAMESISDHERAALVYPITQRPRFEINSSIGHITSACGLTVYLGGAFPSRFHGMVLVAEPAHNLVHRDVVKPTGSTFTARRAYEGKEFLAATDAWFRPVNFTIGPDGALYMIDYYRPIIEHPEYMSSEYHGQDHQHTQELYHGSDRGRIYRIVPDSGTPFPLANGINLGAASDFELVRQLENPNIWWRRTAQRLLVTRKATGVQGELERMFEESATGVARLHALWTLEGLGNLDLAHIEHSLEDSEPGVRENGIILAESRLAESPRLAAKLLGMANDPDPRVRFQLLSTLGFLNTASARRVRDRLLFENLEDKWMRVSALSASSDEAVRLFRRAVSARSGVLGRKSGGRRDFLRQITLVIGARQKRPEIGQVLGTVVAARGESSAWWRAATLEGLAQGLGRRGEDSDGLDAAQKAHLLRLAEADEDEVRQASLGLLAVTGLPHGAQLTQSLSRAANISATESEDPGRRADAIRLLTLAGPERWAADLKKLVTPSEPEPVQQAAAEALGRIEGDETGKFFLSKWRAMTTPVRWEAANAMVRDPAMARLLVAALQDGSVQTWTLAFRHRHRLIMYGDEEIRAAARQVLESNTGEREQVLERYEEAAEKEGDVARGREVFKEVCGKCHTFEGEGIEVGPDLGTVRSQPKQIILTHVLIPNRAITQNYETYVVETASGATLDGVLGAQSSTSITLRREEGEEDVILRKDIQRMYVSQHSAMPNDLEKQVTVEQMTDLLTYLKDAR